MSQSVYRKTGGIMVAEYNPEYVRDILIGSFILLVGELLTAGVAYLWIVIPLGFLYSLGYIMVVRPVIIEFDRHKEAATVIRPGAFGIGLLTFARVVSFSEIAWIEVRSRRNRGGGIQSALKLRLKNDEGIAICGYELESGECMRRAKAFSEFMKLSVPPKIE